MPAIIQAPPHPAAAMAPAIVQNISSRIHRLSQSSADKENYTQREEEKQRLADWEEEGRDGEDAVDEGDGAEGEGPGPHEDEGERGVEHRGEAPDLLEDVRAVALDEPVDDHDEEREAEAEGEVAVCG